MSTDALEGERIDGQRRPWRDPFVIAFIVGAAFLTVLPLIQRLALHAPEPLTRLEAWSLREIGGDATLGSDALRGKVWLASFVPAGCDADCKDALTRFGGAAQHVADLGDKVALVSFVEQGAEPIARAARAGGSPSWRLVGGDDATLAQVWRTFAASWDAQVQSLTERKIAFLARPTVAVVDQDGAIRGLWPADDDGRGHAINAARMFARYGTEP